MLPRISLVEGEETKFLIFSTNDVISKNLFNAGVWEDHLVKITNLFCEAVDSPLLIDIGANLGSYSIPIAKNIQEKNGQVIAFEPQRIIYYQLCANAFINRLENFYAFNKAVSDKAGDVEIPEFDYSTNNNIGAFSLDKNARIEHGIESSVKNKFNLVESIKLDELEVDRAPAFIKMDVEGYEINVLRGALSFLKRHNYPPFLFEAWDLEWFSSGKKELLDFVTKIGYSIFKVDSTNYIAQHPENAISIDLKSENGIIYFTRKR